MRTPIVSQAEQIVRLRSSLSTYKSRIASLERQNSRLLATDYQQVAEREIYLLQERIREIEARWLEAESECVQLRRHLQVRSVA